MLNVRYQTVVFQVRRERLHTISSPNLAFFSMDSLCACLRSPGLIDMKLHYPKVSNNLHFTAFHLFLGTVCVREISNRVFTIVPPFAWIYLHVVLGISMVCLDSCIYFTIYCLSEKMSSGAAVSDFDDTLCCKLCFELFDNPVLLSCGHSICLKCAETLSAFSALKSDRLSGSERPNGDKVRLRWMTPPPLIACVG